MIEIVFETHSTTVDNEAGIATGWLPGELSPTGVTQARELGERRRGDGLSAVFVSDLRRAVQTVEIAFAGVAVSLLHDWRLRECNYGAENGTSASELHAGRAGRLDTPYPGGESWREAAARVGWFLHDLARLPHPPERVLVVGHVATHLGLEHVLGGAALEQLILQPFAWQPGWHYRMATPAP